MTAFTEHITTKDQTVYSYAETTNKCHYRSHVSKLAPDNVIDYHDAQVCQESILENHRPSIIRQRRPLQVTQRRRLSGGTSPPASVHQSVASCHLSFTWTTYPISQSICQSFGVQQSVSMSVCQVVSISICSIFFFFFGNMAVSLKVMLQVPNRSLTQFVSHLKSTSRSLCHFFVLWFFFTAKEANTIAKYKEKD